MSVPGIGLTSKNVKSRYGDAFFFDLPFSVIWLFQLTPTSSNTFDFRLQNLLTWLRQRRDEGYHIVGLEQTSSSESLLEYQFPPSATFMSDDVNNTGGTVLLLGKEKEGIPIEFLQMVDQCIEIPQYGIIRSLNVHVSGAIAIWEYTKQQQQRKNLHKM